MQKPNTYCHRIFIVAFLILGLILVPMTPPTVMAAEQGAGGAGSTSDSSSTGAGGGAAAGVGVSGAPGKASPSGKGALAPPSKKSPTSQPAPVEQTEPDPVKQAEQKKPPKAIGASAGKAGPTTTESSGGMSMGWKIAAGVLGVGLLVSLVSSGGGGGTTTTPTHTP